MSITAVPANLRIILFFARNPGETLTSLDMEAKFGLDLGSVLNVTSKYMRAGLLARVDDNGPGRPALYGAGPELLALIRSDSGEIVEAA